MKKSIAILLLTILTGCGYVDREVAKVTGGGSKTCVDGVLYLQFTSGATVAYEPSGKIKTCSK